MTTDGLDISSWQATTPPLTGKAFLIARATYGTSPDVRYSTHIAAAKAAGLVTGAYCFGRGSTSGATQAAIFMAVAGPVDLFVLDLETQAPIYGPNMTWTQARAFIAAVKATGRKVGLYASESGYPSLGQDYNWIANWSQVPALPWTIHQYRGSPLDLDHYNGTVAQLKAFVQKAPPATIHYRTLVTVPTALWNDATHLWMFNGASAIKVGTRLVVRSKQFVKGPTQVPCYPVTSASGAPYFVPVAHVGKLVRI